MKCPECGKPAIRKTSTSDGSIVSYVHSEMKTSFGPVATEVCHIFSDERKAAYKKRDKKIRQAKRKGKK